MPDSEVPLAPTKAGYFDYCEQIGRQTYLLAQLISEHRELVNAPPSVPGFTHY
ncbi:TPA: hypothetical protein NIB55_004190 [Pseudomonas aeruginosa]|nr:hypothetical protein [Pseudomonas aeruginosa]